MYKLISSLDDGFYSQFLSDISKTEVLFMDTETTGLDPITDKVRLIQFNVGGEIYIFNAEVLSRDDVIKVLREVENHTLVFHNAKFDVEMVYTNYGIMLETHCTMIGEVLIDSGLSASRPSSYAALASKYCGVEVEKKGRDAFTEQRALTEEMLVYSALDVKYLPTIYTGVLLGLAGLGLNKVAQLEWDLISTVAHMELNGMLMDQDKWMATYNEFKRLAEEASSSLAIDLVTHYVRENKPESALVAYEELSIPIKKKDGITPKPRKLALAQITDPEFIIKAVLDDVNIGSNKQLGILLNYYGITVENTNETTLQNYNPRHEIIDRVIQFRGYDKRVKAYGPNYIERIHPVTGRIHPDINQVGTVTGRMSSNLHQIPVKPEDGVPEHLTKSYRNSFIASPGYKIFGVDYGTMEYRFAGALSGDETLIKAFQDGRDLHTDTASHIFGVPYEEVTPDQRQTSKKVNFSMVYQSSAWGLSWKNPEISLADAEDLVEGFYTARAGLKKWIDEQGQIIIAAEEVRTTLGRLRKFNVQHDFVSHKQMRKHHAKVKRDGVSTIVQGSAADCVKLAMLAISRTNPFGDKLRMLLQIHDEIVFEAAEDIVEEAKSFVLGCMLQVEQKFLGPVPADASVSEALDYWTK